MGTQSIRSGEYPVFYRKRILQIGKERMRTKEWLVKQKSIIVQTRSMFGIQSTRRFPLGGMVCIGIGCRMVLKRKGILQCKY